MNRTPLERAASWYCIEIFKYLVEDAGANYKDKLVLAQVKKPGNDAILDFVNQKLTGGGTDDNKTPTKEETDPTAALFSAIKNGNVDALKKLAAETTVSFNKARTADGYSALQYAIQCGQLPVVRYLFENHQPDKIFTWGTQKPNALHWAAVRGKTEIARYLIEEQGFYPDKKDSRGSDAFCYAISAKINNTETIDFFIKNYRAGIEQKDEFGQTALMRAISYGNLTTVKYLIEEAGANTSASSRNSFGKNIYQIAANINSDPDILKYLVTTLKPDPEQVLGRASIEEATTLATKEYLRTLFK